MKNYYKIMGLKLTATESEIKSAYRLLAKRYHPDVNPGNSAAAEKFADLTEANEVLSDLEKKIEYDRQVSEAMQQRNNASARQTQNPSQNPYMRPQYQQQFQQQYQQQYQQQQIFQKINEAQATGYNKGYESGFNDAKTRMSEEADRLKKQLFQKTAAESKYREEIERLKKTLDESETNFELIKVSKADADELMNGKLASIKAQLNSAQNGAAAKPKIKTVTSDNIISGLQEQVFSLESKNAEIKKQLATLDSKVSESTGRALKAESALTDMKAEKNKLVSERNYYENEYQTFKEKFEEDEREIAILNQSVAQWEEFSKSLDMNDAIKSAKSEWDRIMREEKKKLKDTHYGTLGVTYWSTQDEIKDSFKKLVKRFQKKAAEDKQFEEKLFAVNEAYKVLSVAAKRKEYNAKIGITEEDVLLKLEEQEKFRERMEMLEQEKGDQEFWAFVEELMYNAQTGDAEAQNTLGEMYYYGDELDKDLTQATYWFKEAAKQKNPEGMYNLGVCFLTGEGVEKDALKGKGFIKQAAKLGSVGAGDLIKADFKLYDDMAKAESAAI